MAGSLNRVILIGSVGKDPEVRTTQDGIKIVNLSLATSETWKDRSGEKQVKTEWHRIVVFNDRIADVAEKYLKKGALIAIEGALQTREWTDQAGAKRYSTEVVIGRFNGSLTMLDRQGGGGGSGSQQRSGGGAPRQQDAAPRELEDDIPF